VTFGVGRGGLLLAAVMAIVGVAGCSRSAEQVENAVKDKPGVLGVEVTSHPTGPEGLEGPDTHAVEVRMDQTTTPAEVMGVFDALDEAVDDGDVESIEVVLCCKGATLATGQDMHATADMAADLVAAHLDDQVKQYRRQTYPVLPSVEITLVPLPFDDVVAFADQYRDDESIEDVEVLSGGFLLIRDSVNEDLTVTDARQGFVQRVLGRFSLLGAGVTGRGPLDLYVAPADAPALSRYVARRGDELVGRVVVRTRRPPW